MNRNFLQGVGKLGNGGYLAYKAGQVNNVFTILSLLWFYFLLVSNKEKDDFFYGPMLKGLMLICGYFLRSSRKSSIKKKGYYMWLKEKLQLSNSWSVGSKWRWRNSWNWLVNCPNSVLFEGNLNRHLNQYVWLVYVLLDLEIRDKSWGFLNRNLFSLPFKYAVKIGLIYASFRWIKINRVILLKE